MKEYITWYCQMPQSSLGLKGASSYLSFVKEASMEYFFTSLDPSDSLMCQS